MNPFELVWCYNSDADERHVTRMRRWELWWCQWFGNDYARCWHEDR